MVNNDRKVRTSSGVKTPKAWVTIDLNSEQSVASFLRPTNKMFCYSRNSYYGYKDNRLNLI